MKKFTWISMSFCFFFVFSIFLGIKTWAIDLPDTGQITCYDASGNAITCPDPGQTTAQDGSYSVNPMSYTDNGDGTVTDNITSLIWQQEDDGNTYNWYRATGTYHATYNPNTVNVCGDLGAGWRLPTSQELGSLIDYSVADPGPAINYIFTNTANLDYWSSNIYPPLAPNYAWGVHFRVGGGSLIHKGTATYVRCVNGQYPASDFVDNGDNTITDKVTSLMWQKGEGTSKTWINALSYCESLTLGGYTNWRLPTPKELETLVDYSLYNPAINTSYFSYSCRNYWLATTHITYPSSAWTVNFKSGGVGNGGKGVSLCARCVRNLIKWPLSGLIESRTILSEFGDNWLEYCNGQIKKHTGIDIEAEEDETVYAAESGIVKAAQTDQDWGGWVTLEHGGQYTTVYWHITPSVSVNDTISKGDPIGTIVDYGGPVHLHFGLRNGSYSNTSNRGALPQSICDGDPAFPENFVNPGATFLE